MQEEGWGGNKHIRGDGGAGAVDLRSVLDLDMHELEKDEGRVFSFQRNPF